MNVVTRYTDVEDLYGPITEARMNVTDFLHSVRPGLEPDVPQDRQRELREGSSPTTHDEEVWCDWHGDEIG